MRKTCACGRAMGPSGECANCRRKRLGVQAKLRVNQPGDKYEQEADRVADQVINQHSGTINIAGGVSSHFQKSNSTPQSGKQFVGSNAQKKLLDETVMRESIPSGEIVIGELDAEKDEVQRAYNENGSGNEAEQSDIHNSAATNNIETRLRGLNGSGDRLGTTEKNFMESRFGFNFDAVRIHTGPDPAGLAHELNARAFTLGNEIVFGEGEYRPQTSIGRTLLAHELTHVVQQTPDSNRTIYRQETEESPPMTRSQEIRLSLTSPGHAVPQASPPALSLYNFGIDRAEPKRFHSELLREFARFVSREITVPVRIRVVGHASAPGTTPHNVELARQRAEQIVTILQTEGLSNVQVFSGGESAPVASNDTVEGRSRNRRVDITLSAAPIPDIDPDIPEPDPTPIPPEPTRPDPPKKEDEGPDFCDRYPILCDLIPPIPIPIPIPLPWWLICALAPELCMLIPCMINPLACIPGPPGPPIPPEPPEPPDRPDRDHLPRVEFGRIRAANTPSVMGDRIPDQGSLAVRAEITGHRPSMPAIQIEPVGANRLNGEFEINGGRGAAITSSTNLNIAGTSQTSTAAAAFRLRLKAVMGTEEVGRSEPFAVSDIMFNMSTRFEDMEIDPSGTDTTRTTPEWLGLVTIMGKDTDGASGLTSLREVAYTEKLDVMSETGGMRGFGTGLPFEDALAQIDNSDTHLTPRRHLRAIGVQELMQTHTFSDFRTGSVNIPVTNSGFKVVRSVERDDSRGRGCLKYVAKKIGMGGTAAGVRSGAGSGSAEATAPLPCMRGGHTPPGGTTPTTPSIPTPFFGPLPSGKTPFSFVSLTPPVTTAPLPTILTISFRANSLISASPSSRLFTSPIPCVVISKTATHVILRTVNAMPLSLAPPGFELSVVPALMRIDVPLSLLP